MSRSALLFAPLVNRCPRMGSVFRLTLLATLGAPTTAPDVMRSLGHPDPEGKELIQGLRTGI